jgi:ornithine cyclodeaminase
MTLLTAFRTAATSAVAASLLARPQSQVMALIGAGAQAEFQSLAFNIIAGVTRVRCFDPDSGAMAKLARNLGEATGLHVELCPSMDDALEGADIITTATAAKTRQALLTPRNVRGGVHINAIGGDCPGKTELAPDLLRRARVFVEYEPQTRIEGEIQNLDGGCDVQELWPVVAGIVPGRLGDDEITLFDSVGFAVEDFSALRYVHELTMSLGIGREVAFVPRIVDPKDLFSALS